jgi:hypothetical protein
MCKLVLLILFLSPAAVLAESLVSVSTQQCVWHPGDDTSWAASALDESSWQPWSTWHADPNISHFWIRCHPSLATLTAAQPRALQIQLFAAYQAWIDASPIGQAGNLNSGNFSMDIVRSFALPSRSQPRGSQPSTTIALRVTPRLYRMVPAAPLPPFTLYTGDPALLRDRRISLAITQGSGRLTPALCFSIIGVIGFVFLGLFLYDRSRHQLVPLIVVSVGLIPLYLNYFFAASLLGYSSFLYVLAWALPALTSNVARVWFFFALAGKRVPLLFRLFIAIGILGYALAILGAFLPGSSALRLDAFRVLHIEPVTALARIGESCAPFVAFWPWSGPTRRMRPLAALCMAWGATMIVFFAVQLSVLNLPILPHLNPQWSTAVADAEAVTTLAVMISLLGFLFRQLQDSSEQRAILAGEMQAARQVQSMLAPAILDTVPGVRVQVAFHPMREVGGDFYLCRSLPGGRQRILLGDVSGKGTAAAMTATLLIGAAERRDTDSPAQLLAHLNLVLRDSRVGGFATCLCADLTPDGILRLANAGHLPPYRGAEEIVLACNLPLGLDDTAYPETALQLAPNDSLTFLSDGVVEARNATGELYGFDRTAAISTRPAEEIALAASTFGQEDDITVLTLAFTGAGAPFPLETARLQNS